MSATSTSTRRLAAGLALALSAAGCSLFLAAPGDGVDAGEGEGDVVGKGEGEGEGDVVGEGEGEGDVVGEGEGEGEGEGDAGEGEGEGEGEGDAGEGEGEGEGAGEGEGEGEGQGDLPPTCPPGSNDVVTIAPDDGLPFAVRCFDSENVPVAVSGLEGAGSGWVLVLSVSADDSAAGTFGGVPASADDDVWGSNRAFGAPTVVAEPIASARSEAYGRHPAHEVLLVFTYSDNDRRAVRLPFSGAQSLLDRLQAAPQTVGVAATTWRAFSPVENHLFAGQNTNLKDGTRPPSGLLGATASLTNIAAPIEVVGLGLQLCGNSVVTAGARRANTLLASCEVERHVAAAVVFVR